MHAQIFVKADAAGTNDGTSWANAFTNLQDGLDAAIVDQPIWVAAATYMPLGPTPDSSHFISRHPIQLYGGFDGTESDISERDWQKNLTIFSGDINGDDTAGNFLDQRSDNAHHVFILYHIDGQSVLDGITFSGGMTRTDAFAIDDRDTLYNRWRGGALYVKRAGVNIANCAFLDNYGFQGSAILAGGDTLRDKFFVMENVSIHSNSASSSGVVWISGWRNAQIHHSSFTANTSVSFGAGLTAGNSNLMVSDCSFYQNSASQGAGTFLFNNASGLIKHPRIQFQKCTYTENVAGGTGGAIRMNNFAKGFDLEFDSCSFSKNSTTAPFGYGGALLVNDFGDTDVNERLTTIKISNSEFTENSAAFSAGAEFDMYDDSSRIEISNTRFYKNTSPQNGGGSGLYFFIINNAVVDAHIVGSTFEENTSSLSGGGLVFDFNSNVKPSSFDINACHFLNNHADAFGGAIASNAANLSVGPVGTIRNSTFNNNDASGMAGAIFSLSAHLTIEDSKFSGNSSEGLNAFYPGSGATYFATPSNIVVRNTIYENNISDDEAGAVFIDSGAVVQMENVLLSGNEGHAAVLNRGSLNMVNNSVLNNGTGIHLASSSITELQNSIFDNSGDNILLEDSTSVITKGGNISSDLTMESILTGYAGYADLNDTDPLLGPDFVPVSGSPAIDMGNVEGIKFPYDLAGNARVQGGAIDAGSFESFLSATHDAKWNASELTVYPNPLQDVMNINLETDYKGEIQVLVFNQAGQQVHHATMMKSLANEILQNDIHALVPGEYYLLVRTNQDTYATNLVVIR